MGDARRSPRCGTQLFARGAPSAAALDAVARARARHRPARRRRRRSRAPTLVVAGDRDTLAPRAAGAWLAAALPNARFADIAGRRARAVPVASRRVPRQRGAVPRWPLTRAFPRPTRATSIRARCRRAFGRAAATYDAAAVLQREVAARHGRSASTYVKLAPTHDPRRRLRDRRGDRRARRRAIRARASSASTSRCRWRGRRANARGADARCCDRLLAPVRARGAAPAPAFVCADLNALPFARRGVRPRVEQPRAAVGERPAARVRRVAARASRSAGSFTFTTFGPDTLKELRAAFARADGHTHTNRFVDMHDLGDMLVARGLRRSGDGHGARSR